MISLQGKASPPLVITLALFVAVATLYGTTLAPTVVWGDSADFAISAERLELELSANTHPLFTLLGHLLSYFPGDLGRNLNALAAAAGTLCVLFVFLSAYELTRSSLASVVGALSLAVSHAFWLHSVIAEVYTFNSMFVAAVIYCVLRWRQDRNRAGYLYVAGLLFGVGLTNHLILGLAGLAVFLFLMLPENRKSLGILRLVSLLFCLLLGTSLLLFILSRQLIAGDMAGLLDSMTGGNYRALMLQVTQAAPKEMAFYLGYLGYQFPGFAFLLGIWGAIALVRKDRLSSFLLLGILLINMLYFTTFLWESYGSTKYTFYITDYTIFAIFVAVGTHRALTIIREKLAGRGSGRLATLAMAALVPLVVALPPTLYHSMPVLAAWSGRDLLKARDLPYRNNDRFFLTPSKRGDRGPETFALEVFRTAEPDSLIIADYTIFVVLAYFQEIKELRPDVELQLSQRGELRGMLDIEKLALENVFRKTVYVADREGRGYYDMTNMDEWTLVPEGPIFRLVPPETKTPTSRFPKNR